MSFHISKDGKERQCQAQSPESCTATPDDIKEHFDTREEAREVVLKRAAEGQSPLGTVRKPARLKSGSRPQLFESPFPQFDSESSAEGFRTRSAIAKALGTSVDKVRIDPEISLVYIHNDNGSISEYTNMSYTSDSKIGKFQKTGDYRDPADFFSRNPYEANEDTIARGYNVSPERVFYSGNSVSGEHESLAEDENNYVLDGDTIHVLDRYRKDYTTAPVYRESVPANGAKSVQDWVATHRYNYLKSRGSHLVQEIEQDIAIEEEVKREIEQERVAEEQNRLKAVMKPSSNPGSVSLNSFSRSLKSLSWAVDAQKVSQDFAKSIGAPEGKVRVDHEMDSVYVHNDNGSITEYHLNPQATSGETEFQKVNEYVNARDYFETSKIEPNEETISIGYNVPPENVFHSGWSLAGEHEYLAEDENSYVLDGDKIHVISGYKIGFIYPPKHEETIPANGAKTVSEWVTQNRYDYLKSKNSSIIQDIESEY